MRAHNHYRTVWLLTIISFNFPQSLNQKNLAKQKLSNKLHIYFFWIFRRSSRRRFRWCVRCGRRSKPFYKFHFISLLSVCRFVLTRRRSRSLVGLLLLEIIYIYIFVLFSVYFLMTHNRPLPVFLQYTRRGISSTLRAWVCEQSSFLLLPTAAQRNGASEHDAPQKYISQFKWRQLYRQHSCVMVAAAWVRQRVLGVMHPHKNGQALSIPIRTKHRGERNCTMVTCVLGAQYIRMVAYFLNRSQ